MRGLGLIGLNDSLLRACLPREHGGHGLRVRVLLLHLESQALAHRAAEIGESTESLAGGVYLAEARLRELADGGDVQLVSCERLRKPQRATHSSWSFHQLGQFIAYKARRAGVPVVYVDAAYTSRTCAECGHIDRANRVSQAWFACRNCGFVDHADRNGSRNIRARAWELWRRGAQSTAPAPPRTPRGGTGRKRTTTASDARCASPAL